MRLNGDTSTQHIHLCKKLQVACSQTEEREVSSLSDCRSGTGTIKRQSARSGKNNLATALRTFFRVSNAVRLAYKGLIQKVRRTRIYTKFRKENLLLELWRLSCCVCWRHFFLFHLIYFSALLRSFGQRTAPHCTVDQV